jgi:nucleoside-diphosphate-sugar epimerase
MRRLSSTDIDYVLFHTKDLWSSLQEANLLITGGTGFFGRWLIETFLAANKTSQLNASLTVLSRDPSTFLIHHPWLQEQSALTFIQGDVRNFDYSESDKYTHIIHAATDASDKLNRENPLLMFNTIVAGTEHILEIARYCNPKSFLLVSSGAIYGSQPPEITAILESFNGAPNPLDVGAAYANGKRFAEYLCAHSHKQYGLPIKIARCFSFIGPYLPLDTHFAIGNFINDVLHHRDIIIKGNGSPVRSYMYAADLTIALWTILLKGEVLEAYNVGSDQAVSMNKLAEIVADCAGSMINVIIQGDVTLIGQSGKYIPNIQKIRTELKIPELLSLRDSIIRTISWHLQKEK